MSEKPYRLLRCVFSTRRSPFSIFSRLLRIIFWRDYSHVLWYFYSERMDLRYCYEASGGGVHGSNYVWWRKNNKALHYYEMPITKDQWRDIFLPEMRRNEGRPYGKLQILGLALTSWVRFLSFQRIRMANPLGDGWVCSESVLKLFLKLYTVEESDQHYLLKLPGGDHLANILKHELGDVDAFTHVDCDRFMSKYFRKKNWDEGEL